MAELYKRPGSPFWYAVLRDPNHPTGFQRKSTKCRLKSEAREVATALQAQIDEAEPVNPTGLVWTEAAGFFLAGAGLKPSTVHNYVSMTGVIARGCLGDFDLGTLTVERIKAYVAERRQNKSTDATIRRHISYMSAVIRFCIDREIPGAPVRNPFKEYDRSHLGNSKRIDRHLRPNQFEEIFDSCKTEEHRRILQVLVYTGMRTHELCNLYWGEVDFARKYIEFGNIDPDRTKSSRSRRIPMTDTVVDTLLEQRASQKTNPSGLVFPSPQTGGVRRNFGYLIKTIRKRTSVKGYTNHGLRHTFASWCIQKGLDPIALRDILGHTTLSTSMIYARHVTDSVADRFRNLDFPVQAQKSAQIIGLKSNKDDE
jgi:integrase